MKIYQFLILIFSALTVSNFTSCKVADVKSTSEPVSHEQWDSLLKKHVSESGLVDYNGFKNDSVALSSYLHLLETHHPNEKNWTRNERMAYWINAYNAFTIKLVTDHYPVKSIKDIKNGIPFVNTVWDIKFINIEGESYDLNNIEHGILRPKFEDPRIHFAVNCASISCPPLADFAYSAERLDEQLDQSGRRFINDSKRNKIASANKADLSKIFSWFKGDFTKDQGLITFINRYSDIPLDEKADISYLDYDWDINEVQ
jgi:hypothetical protein